MDKKNKFNHKWMALIAGLIIFISGGVEHTAANDVTLSETRSGPPLGDRLVLSAGRRPPAGDSLQSKDVEHEKLVNDFLIDANVGVKRYVFGSLGKIQPSSHIPEKLTVIGPFASHTGSSSAQLLMGIIWTHRTASRRKWNFVFGLGGFNHSPEVFAPFGITEPILENEKNDIADQIRNAIQVVSFEIRFDF